MGERSFLPFIIDLPDPSNATQDTSVRRHLAALNVSVQNALQRISARVNELVMVGTLEERPVANGSHRFYFVTNVDPPRLEFDNGIWYPL